MAYQIRYKKSRENNNPKYSRDEEYAFNEKRERLYRRIQELDGFRERGNRGVADVNFQIRLLQDTVQGLERDFADTNSGLVISTSERYAQRNRDLELDEIFEAFSIAFLRSITTFDPSKAKFSTYATAAMLREGLRLKQRKFKERRLVTNMTRISRTGEYEDFFTHTEDEKTTPVYYGSINFEQKEKIEGALMELEDINERSAFVIRERFGLNEDGRIRTLDDIGKEIGVTRERVRQIVKVSLERLQMIIQEGSSFDLI